MAAFPIVGIGSSAGGLEALQKLLRAVPADCGIAFVVAAHLHPETKSHLREILGGETAMPVIEVRDATEVAPAHVYVIAPNRSLIIEQGVLQTFEPSEPRGHRRPVDLFLRSLATDQGECAIAVVLSGTGTNGSAGVRAIKAEGGIVLAQDPETASFDGMPRNAIATGMVDMILPPEDMADALIKLITHSYVQGRSTLQGGASPDHTGAQDQLDTLLELVRARTLQDFRSYRRRTVLRRVHRRMGLRHIEDLGAYIDLVRVDPGEAKALAMDLTINVSGFFRDPEAWRKLDEKVIAPLVEERAPNTPIRVWAPGCATGEEAYSLVMLLFERADALKKSLDLRVFATDVVETALSSARSGLYPGSVAADVGGERLQRFFDPDDDNYRVKRSLREMITFTPHNLLQDPSFSRLDLISCRNLLIYLEPEIQKRVLGVFHFALSDGGYLFLGPAETITGQEDLFEAISRKWRIYRRKEGPRHLVDFPLVARPPVPDLPTPDSPGPWNRPQEWFQRRLLHRHAPPSVLVDSQLMVRAYHGATGDYIQQPGGEPTNNLLALARDGLQASLRSAVTEARERGQEVMVEAHVKRGMSRSPIRITASRLTLTSEDQGYVIVSFLEHEPQPAASLPPAPSSPADESRLEAELNATREELRLTIEQMEASNEELKASYEEIRSINEELQASNEELETSKEELQSLNEELRTVNNQLQAKIEELERRTDDLNNLLNSTDVATLFLDQYLRIRWFTPTMKALLALVPTDVGRPVYHFAQQFTGEALVEEAREVLRTLVPRKSEVQGADERWFISHVLPYRTEDNRIDGVVITFTDITERKAAERTTEAAQAFAQSIVDTVREPLVVLTPDLRVRSANRTFYRTFEVRPEATEGYLIYELGNRQWDIPALRRLLEEILPANAQFDDFEVEHEFETIGRRTMRLNARRLDAVDLILLALEDVTGRRQPAAADS